MKPFISLYIVFFSLASMLAFSSLHAQTIIDTVAIQKESKKAPRRYTKDPIILANYLAQNYTDDNSKVIAFTYWIANNIKYSFEGVATRDQGGLTTLEVLKKRKAICGEYSQLFTDMCAAEGIKTAIVGGYIKEFDHFDEDTIYRTSHAWSVVQINGDWQLLDVTFGSGYSGFKKQYFAKMMWKYFKVPYELKPKYIKEYSPNWFFVDPNQMVFSHLPVLEMYQLLENPVSQTTFEAGPYAIRDYVHTTKVDFSSNKINTFLALPVHEQYKLEGDLGFASNQNNHRIQGFNYYRSVHNLHKSYYNSEFKLVQTNNTNLEMMHARCAISDSMMVLSISDNEKEFIHKEHRSLEWKSLIQNTNNMLRDSIKHRISLNKKQKLLVDKTNRKNHDIVKYAKGKTKKLNSKKIVVLRGPSRSTEVNPKKSARLLQTADSLHATALQVLDKKDSLLEIYTSKDQLKMLDVEELNWEIYTYSADRLSYEYSEKKADFPQIYLQFQPLKKEWFQQNFTLADERNKTYNDTVLVGIYENQNEAKSLMKQYQTLMKLAIKDIKLAKKSSDTNQFEQEMYEQYSREMVESFETYSNQVKTYLAETNILKKILDSENRQLRKANKILIQDNWFENHRHRSYMHYCKSVKKSETRLAKAIIKQVKKMDQQIENTQQYRVKFKEKELISRK